MTWLPMVLVVSTHCLALGAAVTFGAPWSCSLDPDASSEDDTDEDPDDCCRCRHNRFDAQEDRADTQTHLVRLGGRARLRGGGLLVVVVVLVVIVVLLIVVVIVVVVMLGRPLGALGQGLLARPTVHGEPGHQTSAAVVGRPTASVQLRGEGRDRGVNQCANNL